MSGVRVGVGVGVGVGLGAHSCCLAWWYTSAACSWLGRLMLLILNCSYCETSGLFVVKVISKLGDLLTAPHLPIS